MRNELSKMFYKINEVSEIIGVPTSTLRFWEKEFNELKPRRSNSNLRYYTPNDIETLHLIKFLLKDKGLKIDAAKEQLKVNRKNIERRLDVIFKLSEVKEELEGMLLALRKRQ